MKFAPFTIVVLLIAGISCKKTVAPTVETPKYLNLAPGSSRTYETTNNITTAITSNVVISTARDSSISGKVYHVFTNSNGAANEYFTISGTDYYTFRNLVAIGSGAVEDNYLKADAVVGASWSQSVNVTLPGSSTVLPLVVTNTTTAKGITRTVNSKVYTNVIHITTSITSTSLPAGSLTTDIQSYYAPNYSLIENKNKVTITLVTGSNVDQVTILKSANF
jgi:hypothetical protein